MRFGFFFILILLVSPSASAQPTNDVRKGGNEKRFRVIERIPTKEPSSLLFAPLSSPYSASFRQHVSTEEWEKAWGEIKSKKPTASEPHDFVYGYVALRFAQLKDDRAVAEVARRTFKSGIGTSKRMPDYYRFYAALAALEAGKPTEAAELAAKVEKTSLLHSRSLFLMAESLFASGDLERGERALSAATALYPDSSQRANALKQGATSYVEKEKWNDAARLLKTIVVELPGTSAERDAIAYANSLEKQFPKAAWGRFTSRTDDEVDTLYQTLFDAHSSERVVAELPKFVSKRTRGKKEWCDLKYLVARSYTKLRKHPDAIKQYTPIVKYCPKEDGPYLKSLYQLGRSQWNAGQPEVALKTFQRLHKEFPKHSYADDAMNYRSRILLELGKTNEAEKVLAKQLKTYPDGDMAADARWLRFRKLFVAKNYKGAVAFAAKNAEFDKGDVYSGGRLTYFSGRAVQLSGDKKAAREAYQNVVTNFPLSYYGLLAINRLAELNGTSGDICAKKENCAFFASSFPEIKVGDNISKDPRFLRGASLLSVGLHKLAESEIVALRKSVSKDELWGLAKVMHRAKAYPYSHDLARRHTGDWEDTYPSKDLRWQISYPTPFDRAVAAASKKHHVDRAIIYAIMREESGFNPVVKSWAGAYGLLQLMPDTARTTSKKAGISYRGKATLYEPEVAIDIGTAYIADLGEESKGHPALMIAGYNGGWGNIDRWLRELPSKDLDLFVEDITYGQTRKYTKRVLRSYWVYKFMSGERGPRLKMVVD